MIFITGIPTTYEWRMRDYNPPPVLLLYIIVVSIFNVNVLHFFLGLDPIFHVPLRPLDVAFSKSKLHETHVSAQQAKS